MNGNLPRAARVIHAALRSVPPDQATAAARALDSAHLLTDPARSYGLLLHREPNGAWTPRTGHPPTEPERPVGELEPESPPTDRRPVPKRAHPTREPEHPAPGPEQEHPAPAPEPEQPATLPAPEQECPAPEPEQECPAPAPEPERPVTASTPMVDGPGAESERPAPAPEPMPEWPGAESERPAPASEPMPEWPGAESERSVTELERQALAWDDSCARARQVARAVERQLHGHPGPHGIRVDGDRVRVLLRVDDPAQWARWRAYLGLTDAGERSRPHTVTAEGERDGVPVTVVARGSGTAPPSRAGAPERRPFRLDGTSFDLALPQRDTNGDLWYFQGCRAPDGMPLLSLDGRPERCTLAQVEAQLGPLSPARPSGRT
ncbi:BN159_2729 family protein [Streptomyces sp. NPDC005820]|uniref:BN159_2729 family protein n=1 Tax=Streptomyces sp. NPDC005820 TaxID=3157069 RepID=UPI0033D66B4A